MPEDRYKKAAAERKNCVDNILASKSPRKVIVAGPGTGKTLSPVNKPQFVADRVFGKDRRSFWRPQNRIAARTREL